jgi:hypothetical protein
MNKTTIAALAAVGWAIATIPVAAEEMTLGDIKAQSIPRMSKDELAALLPGSTYNQVFGPSVRVYWKHEPDGTLNGARSQGRPSKLIPRTGKWWVMNDGAYCVDTVGQTADDTVKSCRYLYKVGDNYFGYGPKADDSLRVPSFTLSK